MFRFAVNKIIIKYKTKLILYKFLNEKLMTLLKIKLGGKNQLKIKNRKILLNFKIKKFKLFMRKFKKFKIIIVITKMISQNSKNN